MSNAEVGTPNAEGSEQADDNPQSEIDIRRSKWLSDRRTGLGGSDSAAALGESPWKSRYELWAQKAGLVPEPDLSDLEAVEWGNRLERVIGDAYMERTGRHIRRWPSFKLRRHKQHPWLLATPDAEQGDESRGTGYSGLLQIKTTGAFNVKEWEEEPPLHYQIQLQHELLVTGRAWGTLACLVGGQKLVSFDFDRNERFCQSLVEELTLFWNGVLRKEPPRVDGSESTARTLLRLHPKDTGAEIILPDEAVDWARRLAEIKLEQDVLKASQKTLQEERDLLENLMKAEIGPATIGRLPTGGGYSWKHQTLAAYEVAEAEFRVLRPIKAEKR